MLKRLFKTKTFWASLAALVTAAEQVVTGQSTLAEALQIAIPAILALLLRDGIAKTTTQTDGALFARTVRDSTERPQ